MGEEVARHFDPRFPMNNYADFSRELVREMATGMLVSYPSLGNDLTAVNFSSIRAGLLDERDSWRVLQRWFIEHFHKPVFAKWIEMACLTVLADLNITPEQRKQIEWRPRGWEWVDPVKDADAAILRLANGFSTYSRELAQSLDFVIAGAPAAFRFVVGAYAPFAPIDSIVKVAVADVALPFGVVADVAAIVSGVANGSAAPAMMRSPAAS